MRTHIGWTSSWIASFSLALACGSDPGGVDGDGSDSSADGTGGTTANVSAGDTSGATTTAADGDAGDTSGPGGPPPPPPPIYFDLGGIPDAPPPTCGGPGGGLGGEDLSYIWISNSAQGTISKIDTVTMAEEGRYLAREFTGDPSRTSVNLIGDVAVANRNGGVAKFYADVTTCPDVDGNGVIDTSTGSADILAWNDEECRAWFTPLTCGSNRPVAWTRGEWNQSKCTYEDVKLWTACDNNVHRLDGETGVIEDTIPVPGGGGFAFVYGGAADADGNFWGLDSGAGRIFRVDGGDLSTGFWTLPPSGGYGIAVDHMGRPWVCGGGGVSRFDIPTATWASNGGGGIGGCMTDGMGTMWHSNPSGLLLGFDTETLAIVDQVQLPEYVHGISVDFQGNVWGVSFAGSNAYRANPVTGAVATYSGLFGAYTYSDMTGFALSTAGGGGVPPT